MKIDLTVGAFIIHEHKVLLIHHDKLDLWLPVGGHIEANETPDTALRREVKEETNLDVEFLHISHIKIEDRVKENCALPFHTNLHSVGDHDHYGLFFACSTKNPEKLKLNHEIRDYRWFNEQELKNGVVVPDVRNQALYVLHTFRNLNKSTHS